MGAKTMQVDKHYTPQQAAEIVGMTDDGIVSLIHSGEIIATNVARSKDSKRPRWRIAESDLGRFLLSRRHPASLQQSTKSTRRPKQTGVKQFFS
jgi:hypothetical protein